MSIKAMIRRVGPGLAAYPLVVCALIALSFSCKPYDDPNVFKNDDPSSKWTGGPFVGHVYDADTKKPIQGAQIYVQWNGMAAFATGTLLDQATAETDINGRFFVRGINTTPWTVDFYLYKYGYYCWTPGGGFDNAYELATPEVPDSLRYNIKLGNNEIYLKKWAEAKDNKNGQNNLRYCGNLYRCQSYWEGKSKDAGIFTGICKESKREDEEHSAWYKKTYEH